MKAQQIFWVICSTLFIIVNGAPKPAGENADHGNKDIDEIVEVLGDSVSTIPPSETVDLPENWDQAKDDSQSLFLNKSDKNDLEPYPMALSDDAYDGQPIPAANPRPAAPAPPAPGTLEHVVMRAELYGEPPSMGRQASRRKRGGRSVQPASHNNHNIASRLSAINRFKRESDLRSDEILALLSLWEAQQRRNTEPAPTYYSPDSYYNQGDPYEDDTAEEREDPDERWLDEPVIPSSHFSRPYYSLHPTLQKKPTHYQYSHDFPEYIPSEPNYLQNLDSLRRKRQWAGFGNTNRLAKRFMVAKKRSEPNSYYLSALKSIKPRDDLYSLNELLKTSQGAREQGFPITRRMIL